VNVAADPSAPLRTWAATYKNANEPQVEDGANNGDDGSQPLMPRLRPRQAPQPVSEIMDAVIAAVLKFSGGVQADDITLVIARCR
jgi:serine phosphatase RsbU (regulator of sigma subunit)